MSGAWKRLDHEVNCLPTDDEPCRDLEYWITEHGIRIIVKELVRRMPAGLAGGLQLLSWSWDAGYLHAWG